MLEKIQKKRISSREILNVIYMVIVSYTHLDVYKRQDLYSLNPIPETVDETTRQELVEKARNFNTES